MGFQTLHKSSLSLLFSRLNPNSLSLFPQNFALKFSSFASTINFASLLIFIPMYYHSCFFIRKSSCYLSIALQKPAVVILSYGLFLLKVNDAVDIFTPCPCQLLKCVICGTQVRKTLSHVARGPVMTRPTGTDRITVDVFPFNLFPFYTEML